MEDTLERVGLLKNILENKDNYRTRVKYGKVDSKEPRYKPTKSKKDQPSGMSKNAIRRAKIRARRKRRQERERQGKLRQTTNGYNDKGYPMDRFGKLLHRSVYLKHHKYIPRGWHIHHIDGNKLNNALNNLIALHPMIHKQIHQTYSMNCLPERNHVIEMMEASFGSQLSLKLKELDQKIEERSSGFERALEAKKALMNEYNHRVEFNKTIDSKRAN